MPHSDARNRSGAAIDTNLAELFWQAGNKLKGELAQRAATHGLSPQHLRVVGNLATPRPVSEIARLLGTEVSNLVPVIDRLEEDGLVERRPSRHDRRRRDLVLTTRGRALNRRLAPSRSTAMQTFAPLTEAERTALTRLLAKIVDTAPVTGQVDDLR